MTRKLNEALGEIRTKLEAKDKDKPTSNSATVTHNPGAGAYRLQVHRERKPINDADAQNSIWWKSFNKLPKNVQEIVLKDVAEADAKDQYMTPPRKLMPGEIRPYPASENGICHQGDNDPHKMGKVTMCNEKATTVIYAVGGAGHLMQMTACDRHAKDLYKLDRLIGGKDA